MSKIFIKVTVFISLCLFLVCLTGCETTLKDWMYLGGAFAAYINNDAAKESVHEYRGTEYFADEQYLDFDRGSAFKEVVEQYGITEYGEVADFCHSDYSEYNKHYFSEYPNSYILDIQVSEENYLSYKADLTDKLRYRCELNEFQLYEENIPDGQYGTSYVMMGFLDDEKIIRVIYFLSNSDEFTSPGPRMIIRYTNSEMWEA